jgi:hypothetical protein
MSSRIRRTLVGIYVAAWILSAVPLRAKEPAAGSARLVETYGKMPIYFVENLGQLDRRVSYYVPGNTTSLYFTSRGLTFALSSPKRSSEQQEAARWAVALDFVGARRGLKPEGAERTDAVVSYFKGPRSDWKTGLATYSTIVYRDVWPGIDLTYSGTTGRMKYTFVVRPGADPARIRLAYRGASSVKPGEAGGLDIATPLGGFRDDRPVAYQEADGRKQEVTVSYALGRKGRDFVYGFKLGIYDSSRSLVIDPVVLIYCGYIGGDGDDYASRIAVDAAGCAYVTGSTRSGEATFPVTVGPELTFNGDEDAFVAKVKADGTALDYCGYIGGSGYEGGSGIRVDAVGNAYVTGSTNSTEATFPVAMGPDLTLNGDFDAFIAKVSADGTHLVYCGYIGGSAGDYGRGIAVDPAGNAYVTGYAESTEATFPVAVGPDLTYNGGTSDAFVAKVKTDGTGLDYCGYIGGSFDERADGIAVDAAGNAYIAGETQSDETTFPVAAGPDLTYGGGGDAFVAKVRADGTALAYCGYIGGSSNEYGSGIAVDGAGNAYVAGTTTSGEATFPVIVGPDVTYNGSAYDAFVAKVKADGTAFIYCGYIGGDDDDRGSGIAIDLAGNAFVTGWTYSTEATFPVKLGPDVTFNGGVGGVDAFVAKIKADGTGLDFCGYIGGSYADFGYGIAVDAAGNAYVTGSTSSTELTFPVTVGPDLTYNGGFDVFVAKIGEPDCASTAAPIRWLKAKKNQGTDVYLTWDPDPAANGYNLWYVTRPQDIPLARQTSSPPAVAVSGCGPTSPPLTNCTDFGAATREPSLTYFYQVRTYCDPTHEGP